MNVRNVVSSAALAAGLGLAAARAVGRNAAALRAAAARSDGVGVALASSVPAADLRTLAAAGIVDLDLAGRRIKGWCLTAAGRALTARL